MKKLFIFFIKAYQYLISPLTGPSCRFHPTCSSYAVEAFDKLPLHKAILKSAYRILRCHPFSSGGYDPVIKEIKTDISSSIKNCQKDNVNNSHSE